MKVQKETSKEKDPNQQREGKRQRELKKKEPQLLVILKKW